MIVLPAYRKVQIAPQYLLILIFPLMVLTFSELLLSFFGDPNLTLPGVNDVSFDPVVELSARYRFLTAYMFYAIVAILLTAIFLCELIARHTWKSMIYVGIAFVAAALFSMIFSHIEPEYLGSFEDYQLLSKNLFVAALSPGQVPYCAEGAPNAAICGTTQAFHAMDILTETTNHFAIVSSAAIVIGMILALSTPQQAETGELSMKGEANAIVYAQSVIKRYLYLAGLLLSAGMIMGVAWMSWPGDMITDPELRAAHHKLVQSISLYRGTSYSLLILSYYLPVSIILMLRIEVLHAHAEDSKDAKAPEKITAFGIDRIASVDALKAIIAILSPILAGAIGSFADAAKFL